jgi:CRISPR-associated protein Cmr6
MSRIREIFMDAYASYPEDANLSLFYYKLAPYFKENNTNNELKTNFLKQVTKKRFDRTTVNDRIAAFENHATSNIKLETTSRFLCGTGYSSSIEWGFNFDWTTGAPLLPGSSFKGALLSYLEFIAQNQVEDWTNGQTVQLLDSATTWSKEEILEVFGPQGNKGDSHIGGVIFYDVYPSGTDSPFEIDVITPHYKNYYSDPTQHVPDDTESPVPLHFLTVKHSVIFNFCYKIQPFVGANFLQANDDWKEKIDELIVETGSNYGFGAKTASGYGYFNLNQEHPESQPAETEVAIPEPPVETNDAENSEIVASEPTSISASKNADARLDGIRNQDNRKAWLKIAASGHILKVVELERSARPSAYSLPFLKIEGSGKSLKVIYKYEKLNCTVSVKLQGVSSKSEAKYVWENIIKPELQS